MKRLTTEEFIEKSIKVHGDRYDYSLVEYKNAHTKVKIICKEHGVFEQTPNTHLNGSGCLECGGTKQLNTKKFIKKAKEIHGKKYDYSLVNYINAKTKIKIICTNHGEFEQTPNSHLNSCGLSKLQQRKTIIMYRKSKNRFRKFY